MSRPTQSEDFKTTHQFTRTTSSKTGSSWSILFFWTTDTNSTGSLETVLARSSGSGLTMPLVRANRTVSPQQLSGREFKFCPTVGTSNLLNGKTRSDCSGCLKSTRCQTWFSFLVMCIWDSFTLTSAGLWVASATWSRLRVQGWAILRPIFSHLLTETWFFSLRLSTL